MLHDSTICAIATAPGTGAIAIIRLSGDAAISIADKVYLSPKKGKKLADQAANTVHFGKLMDGDTIVDEVVVTLFRAPHSYTGEDSVEIACHGSVHIQQRIVQVLIKNGARMADAGEFTLRAFLAGKMDLSQAEAVADLIHSTSEAQRKMAMTQMRGGFSEEIKKLRGRLLHFISLIELELDFSEEDVEFADRGELGSLIQNILNLIRALENSFDLGNVIKEGVPVTIAGEPNVGKSTLLNAILNEEKAIVSDIAGTTRDAIEDTITINGVNFRFVDTAGLRETTDHVESIGIERAHDKIKQAAIVLLMVDATKNFSAIRAKIEDITARVNLDQQKLLLLLNKTDMVDNAEALAQQITTITDQKLIRIAAKHKTGVETLIEELLSVIDLSKLNKSDAIVSNIRHYEALKQADEALQRALDGLGNGLPTDFLAQDIRQALHYLGEITGEITNDEVLGNIFANFCIGK